MFETYDINGNKLNCKVLFTFHKNNKNFIVYTDEKYDILASYFEATKDKITIIPINNEEDFDLIDEELAKRGNINE